MENGLDWLGLALLALPLAPHGYQGRPIWALPIGQGPFGSRTHLGPYPVWAMGPFGPLPICTLARLGPGPFGHRQSPDPFV